MKLCIIGSGYVGLVTGACFADLGNDVICVDQDKAKIDSLKKGKPTIYEPELEDLIRRGIKENRLTFTTDLKSSVKKSDVIFIAVGTPPRDNGEADMTYVEKVSQQIAQALNGYKLIVEKSTVPVNTGWWVEHTVNINKKHHAKFDVASNPEFLREGQAIEDFMNPDRIVIGVETKKARDILLELYKPVGAPIIVTDIKSAEIIKHASNSFLATKISFMNAVANVCDLAGADVVKVAEGMGYDKRIGKDFLSAGVGFGGSCFPKDLDAFAHISEKMGYNFELLRVVQSINELQKSIFVKKIKDSLWNIHNKTIGVLGLSFKPNTDDMRSAPSIDIIKTLQGDGAKIKAFDPQAMNKAKQIFNGITFCRTPYEAAKQADALLILTEWNEFKELDLKKVKSLMKQPIIADGRNIYEPEKIKKLGFRYISVGRGNSK